MDINELRAQILKAVPGALTEDGYNALEAFLDLPNVDRWIPRNLYLLELSSLFDTGFIFSFLKENTTAEAHKQEFGAAIGRGEYPSPSLASEVHAAALLRSLEATVRFVPRQRGRTPDIEATWGDGIIVDVEVVRGDTRQLHRDVRSGLRGFGGALQAGDVEWNVAAFIVDASNHQDLTAMFEAATKLQNEQSAEDPHKWFVRTIPLDFTDSVGGSEGVAAFGPAWWPSNEPSFGFNSTLGGVAGSPVVILRSLVPPACYMTSVQRKANSGQWREGNPYVIAFDVSQLPRAHERIIDSFPGYFEIWNHVSAVLLFESRFYTGVEGKGWKVSLHRNPYADILLPDHFSALSNEPSCIDFTLSV